MSDTVTLGGSYSYLQDYINLVMKMDRQNFCRQVRVGLLVSETRRKRLSFGAGMTLTTDGDGDPHLLHLGHRQQVFEIRPRKPDPRGEVLLGRGDDCDLVVADDTVSSRHAAFTKDQQSGVYQIRDLSSKNGSRVNGTTLDPEKPVELANGDNLMFGDVAFVFFQPQGLYDALDMTYKR